MSSRGESWPQPTGIPASARLCPRAARLPRAPPGSRALHPAPHTGRRVPDAPERLRSAAARLATLGLAKLQVGQGGVEEWEVGGC